MGIILDQKKMKIRGKTGDRRGRERERRKHYNLH